jgi:hypothetical protein
MNRESILFLFALLTLAASVASADVFTFTYSGAGVSASGIITATPDGSGQYTITDVTGKRNNEPITAFVPNPDPSLALVDNQLYFPADPEYLSVNMTSGFVFETAAGEFNPYYLPPNGYGWGPVDAYYEYTLGGSIPGTPIVFTVSAVDSSEFAARDISVPEPDAVSLLVAMLAGLAGMTGLLRKKQPGPPPANPSA